MDLNNFLLTEKELYCACCRSFLNIPIMLSDSLGNICGRCFNRKYKYEEVVRNKALEAVIKHMIIPCRYSSQNCSILLPYDEISEHEKYCSDRWYKCLAESKNYCSWKGSLSKLMRHFDVTHPDLIIKSDSLCFTLKIMLNVEYKTNFLLSSNKKVFVLKLYVEKGKLWCAVCYLGDDEESSSFEYCIESIKSKHGFYYKSIQKPVLSQKLFLKLEKNFAIQTDLISLKKHFNDLDFLHATLKIVDSKPTEALDDVLLSDLECPVCKIYMLPPILQCTMGHNICNSCKPKLSCCPTCRQAFGIARNYFLETLTNRVKYPCANRVSGCSIVPPGSLITKHEQECEFRTYNCEMTDCTWQGISADFLKHLISVHKVKNIFEAKSIFDGSCYKVNGSNNVYNYIIAFENIFKIGHRYDTSAITVQWNCKIVGAQNKKFKFKLTYTNDMEDDMVIKVAPCSIFFNNDDFFTNAIKFSKSLISTLGIVKCEIIAS